MTRLSAFIWSLQEDPGFQLRVQGTVTVQEGLCVLVPCSFSYPSRVWSSSGQLFISWFRARSYMNCDEPVATNDPDHKVKPETKARFQLVGKVKSRDCSVSIRDARMEDEGTYAFTIDTRKIKYTYADQRLNVQVTGPQHQPHLPGAARRSLGDHGEDHRAPCLLCPAVGLLAPGPHDDERDPHGGRLPAHLRPHLDLLHQAEQSQVLWSQTFTLWIKKQLNRTLAKVERTTPGSPGESVTAVHREGYQAQLCTLRRRSGAQRRRSGAGAAEVSRWRRLRGQMERGSIIARAA
ncbi:uncharacterized protein LOC104857227 isoform X3 [Fukomys damarensis]|uniref:uncharacterized protein LOC104857227 isoform X3 n=1 Tax=Fukomys damarensis TaxID=885580 RepID=UPI00053F6DE4|nr:uncharacterized protein LOC104857227 isoform X3 [Fukomys damarensis]